MTAVYLLTSVNLIILLSGQFVQVAPFIALSAGLLWIYVFGNCKPWRQVLFWMWLAFCILVAVQLFNIGGVTDYKGALKIQFPRYSGLPFTVFPKITALTLITWIAIAGLSVAIRYVDKDAVARCIITLGVLLSLLGITQHHIGIDSFAGVIPLKQPFFSVFAYVNNAGTFFLLCAGLALSRSWRNLPVVVLFAYSTWLTHTRFAWAWFGLFLIIKLTQEETWETLSTGLCLVLSRSLWLSVIAMTTRRIMESLRQEILGRDSEVEAGIHNGMRQTRITWPILSTNIGLITLSILIFWAVSDEVFKYRWHEYGINLSIIREYPLFGVGCHGNSVFNWLYAEQWLHPFLLKNPNTHCDPLVFAVEYGLVGLSILACIATKLIIGVKTRLVNPVALCAILALFTHCLIDMPLRCPAVWVVFLSLTVVKSNSKRLM